MRLRYTLPALAVALLVACTSPAPESEKAAPGGNEGFDQYHRACEIAGHLPVDAGGMTPEETDDWVADVTDLAEIAVQGFDPEIADAAEALLDGAGDDPAADTAEATALMAGLSDTCGRLKE